ncbi:hypothetical protein AZE42_00206 [Rhizopogon vesiculosus]|uniref:Vacuolar fusion protein MON1 n=1 Tax=Rhizopogon vesiculosus TaxID=180088 RepID=A0A1J8QZX1_9AGAM|nr:hypothetical protein AZE42_00206 [Rhizopogon vesiculosus]
MTSAASRTRPSSPTRLVIPSIHPTPSLSNIKDHRSSTLSVPLLPTPGLESSASSVTNLDLNEGILVHDVDPDVDTTRSEDTAVGQIDDVASEESRRNLRDHLRRTLSVQKEKSDAKRKLDQWLDISPDTTLEGYRPREYFVLTDAGKPVFTSRPDGKDVENSSSIMGVVQALLSVFLEDGDKLRCINTGRLRITFLLRSPLYYVCASSWGEPESVTRSHLEYLHLQILSIVTASQLRRIFERRTNFDLRRLLDGAEPFLFSLLDRIELDLAMATSSLNCLQLDQSLRVRVAEALVPTSKMKDTLYIILVARDIHILVNTVYSPSIVNSPASASWIPVCLPKFNPAGFVNAYITFFRRPDADQKSYQRTAADNETDVAETISASNVTENSQGITSWQTTRLIEDSGIGLVCISGGGEFETVRAWCDTVTQKLSDDGSLEALVKAVDSGKTSYFASQLGIPGLRHFVYKSRPHVQITLPAFEEPYDTLDAKRRIVTLYQIIHDAIHAKSGQTGNLKLQYIRTEKEIVMGWITQPFELYVVLSPRLPKTAVINAANAVTRRAMANMSSMFRISLSKIPLSRSVFLPIQNVHSRTVTTTVSSAFRRPDVPSPRGLFVNACFLLVIPTSLAPGQISTPQDFLKAIGRSSETKISVDSWDAFWRTSGSDMKNAGLSIQDRRYILWCMEKFRQNQPIEVFAHEPRPKKKIRGRGPAVQFGKRIRSRRDQ